VLVAHAYNPSYLGGRDQEDRGLKPARANSLRDPISKKNLHKNRTGVVAQDEDSEFKNPSTTNTYIYIYINPQRNVIDLYIITTPCPKELDVRDLCHCHGTISYSVFLRA
jgi:hypothetical protein